MRIYVKLDKKTDLWTIEGRENYGGMFRTAYKSLPVKREDVGATAGIVMQNVERERNAKVILTEADDA